MSLNEIAIEGTIQADGTLLLDQKPNLPAGRVTVVLRQESETTRSQQAGEEFFRMMEGIWAGQKGGGTFLGRWRRLKQNAGKCGARWTTRLKPPSGCKRNADADERRRKVGRPRHDRLSRHQHRDLLRRA